MVKSGADMRRIMTVPGWFHETLGDTHPVSGSLGKVAASWIDCDLYESTPPVLDFLTGRLSVGSVLLFDDWRCFRNPPEFGEQRACAEWLARNPQIRLNDFFDFGFGGKAFTVAACA
jgi:O-methyltransferase